MSDPRNDPVRNILYAIDKLMCDTECKQKVYSATLDVLVKIKKILELTTTKDNELRAQIGRERFRRVLLQLASVLHVLQRQVRGENEYPYKGYRKTSFQDLNQLTIELIRLEVDLTPDLTLKRQRLMDTLDKNLCGNVGRRTQLRLRSQLLETNVTIEKRDALQRLYTRHGQIVDMYQRQCLIEHSSMKIDGLDDSIQRLLLRVANLRHIPDAVWSHLKDKTLSLELPLKKIYIHLKADSTSTYERSQAQKLLQSHSITPENPVENDFRDDTVIDKDYDQEVWRALRHEPIMPSLGRKHDSDSKQGPPNVVTVLQKSRWTVVLGDPGSGKTTFVRWMVYTLISDFLSNQRIDASQNDPGDGVKHPSTDLGIIQLPLLLRVGEFAEALNNKPELTLYDYLGEHTWMGNSVLAFPTDTLDAQKTAFITQFKLAIQDYIQNGCAFIILDGLDEIPAGARRRKIVQLIEDFVHIHVQAPSGRSVFDEHSILTKDLDEDIPITSGGNQILITSRIVGYHVKPLSGNFAHYTVNPLEIAYIQQFIRYWSETLSSEIIKICNLKNKDNICDIQTQGQTVARSLESQIDERTNPGLFSLATNPSLLNLLCTLAFKSPEASLPEKRVCLYHKTVQSLVNIWKEKTLLAIPWNRFDSVLCDVAAYIHEHSASGLIEETDLKRMCTESLKELQNNESDVDLRIEVDEYFEVFRTNTGVLLQRGQYLYGFSHLTFQEYYASRNILNEDKLKRRFQKGDKKTFAEQLAAVFNQHLSDPRYRVILSLGLGWLSWKIKSEFEPFCEHLLKSENIMNQHLPLAALLLTTSARELITLPPNTILMKALDQLLTASAEYRWYRDYVELQREMADGINNLPTDFVREWIISTLSASSLLLPRELVFALCHVLAETGLQVRRERKENSAFKSTDKVKKLILPWSSSTCYKTLVKYLEQDNEEWEYAVDSLLTIIASANPESVFTFQGSLRQIFMSNPALLEKCHPSLMVVITALYGGLYREESDKVHESVRYGRHRPGITYKTGFSPLHMHRESVLTPVLKSHLSSTDIGSLCTELTLYLKQIQPNDTSLRAVDSFIALFCLEGVRNMGFHEQFRTFAAYKSALQRFKRILVYLRQFYFMHQDLGDVSIPSVEDESTEQEQEDFDIDLQQIVTDLLGHLQLSSSLRPKDLFLFLQAAASARVRLCTTLQSFLNPGGAYKINHVEMNLPDVFSEQKFVDDLISETADEDCINLPYFIRLLWTFADKSFNSSMSAEGPFKREGVHTDFMFYQHDKHSSYVLAFVAEYFLPLYICLIESRQMARTREEMDWHSSQLPFTHVLFECMLNLTSSSYYTKEETLKQCLRALTPILNAHGLQSVQIAITLKLEARMKDKRSHSQLGSLDSMRKTAHESVERERAEIQKFTNVTDQDWQQKIDNRLYMSSVSLSFLYSALNLENSALAVALVQTILKIQNPILKLDALTISILNLSHSATYASIGRSLQEKILESVHGLPRNLPPLTSCLLVMRSLTALDSGRTKNDLLLHVLSHLDLLADEKQKEALLTAAIGVQKVTCTSCPTLSFLKQHRNAQCLPYFKIGALQRLCDSNVTPRFFLSHYNSNNSIPVLFHSMYLAELSHDIQVVQAFLDKVDTSKLFEDLPRTLTYSRATVINEILHSISQNPLLLDAIEEQMQEVTTIEPRALHVILQWLMFPKEDGRRVFSYYAALLLCENCLWSNSIAVGMVCDLLVSKNDQFRERAVALIAPNALMETSRKLDFFSESNRQTDSSSSRQNSISKVVVKRSSTVIGTEALVTLMTRWLEYQSTSGPAAFFLSQMFDLLIIDNVLHLEEILKLELQLLSSEVNNTSPQKHVSLFALLGHVSSNVLDSFVCQLSRIFDHDSKEETNATRRLFHRNVLKVASAQLLKALKDAQEKLILCELLWNIASNSFLDEDLRLGAIESLAHSKSETINRLLFTIITEQPKDFSDQLISTAIHSYCHTVDATALDRDVLLDLLHHRSKSISDQVRYELMLVEPDLSSLLDLFDNDYKQCYDSLLNCCSIANDHCETALADLIANQPEPLLGSFLIDLLNNINHFTNEVDQSLTHQSDLLKTATLLFQKMPAAMNIDGDRLAIMDKLKDTLYRTSKQHDVSRRISCLKLISFFNELTPNLCDMIMAAQLDAADVRKVAEDCVLQIKRVSEGAVEKLIKYLSSESLAIRSQAGTVLVQLVLAKVLPLAPVQKAFLDAINRINDEETVDNRRAVMHKRVIHDLLVKMSYSNATAVDTPEDKPSYAETSRNIDGEQVVPWNRSGKNWHLEDVKAAEKAAAYGFCLISGKERERNRNTENIQDFSLDEWPSNYSGYDTTTADGTYDIDEDEDMRFALAESLRTLH